MFWTQISVPVFLICRIVDSHSSWLYLRQLRNLRSTSHINPIINNEEKHTNTGNPEKIIQNMLKIEL